LTRARPRVYPINRPPNTSASLPAHMQALPPTQLESILDRESKRNDKLERELNHINQEHKNEREQLQREIRTLR